jgi:hypothetical protein
LPEYAGIANAVAVSARKLEVHSKNLVNLVSEMSQPEPNYDRIKASR